MERKDCMYNLSCRHATGTRGMNYTMDCIPLKEMSDGRLKVLVFCDRYWKGHDEKKRIRYVASHRVRAKGSLTIKR